MPEVDGLLGRFIAEKRRDVWSPERWRGHPTVPVQAWGDLALKILAKKMDGPSTPEDEASGGTAHRHPGNREGCLGDVVFVSPWTARVSLKASRLHSKLGRDMPPNRV